MCDEIADSPVPVVAAVEGARAGRRLRVRARLRPVVAAEDARFGLPEVGLGLLAGWGGARRLTAQIGPRRPSRSSFSASG